MSELAFDREGNPFRFSRRTQKLRPRRWKNAGQRGTCAAVLDTDGEPVFIDADAEYLEFRAAVGNVPGFYRLDQCDDDGAPIADAPPAYVSIGSTRNAAPLGDVDPRDAIIRDLAQINADVVRTIAERFGSVMQATADVLRAADGAGLPRRAPLPPSPAPVLSDDEGDDEEDEHEDESELAPPHPFGSLQPLIEMAMPHLPQLGALLWTKLQELMKQGAAAPTAPAPAPVPTSTPAPAPAAPSPTSVPGDVAAGPSAPAPTGAAVANSGSPPPATATTAPATETPSTTAAPIPAPATTAPATEAPSTTAAPISAPAAADVAASGSRSPVTATNELPTHDGAVPSSATTSAVPAGTAPTDSPRNAPPTIEPTPEQWAHFFAIRSRLSPREAAIVDTVLVRMGPEVRTEWIADLSMLSVGQAAEVVRSLIPRASPKQDLAVPAPAGPSSSTPTTEPTPEQWAHLLAIRSRLSPREAAIVEAVVLRMTPEMRARWLAELTVLSLEEAAEVVRSQIPKPPPKARGTRIRAADEGEG